MKKLFRNVYVIESVEKNETNMSLTMKSIDQGIFYHEGNTQVSLSLDNKISNNLQLGDLIRYNGEKITLVASMNYTDYKERIKKIDRMKKEEIVALYNSFRGVIASFYSDYSELSERLICDLLDYNYGYCIVKEVPSAISEFINSKEVSDFFKTTIKRKLKINSDVIEILSRTQDFKDMNEEDFSLIYDALQACDSTLCYRFLTYAMNLNSEGARLFLNRGYLQTYVIARIVSTSGLSSRPEYYSGRGVNRGDLNESMLVEVYKKIRRIDVDKADNMAKMTMLLDNLGATNFLNNLYVLAENNYNLEMTEETNAGYYLGNAQGKAREVLALCTILSGIGKNEEIERIQTREMQQTFEFNVKRIKQENQEPVDDGQILKR